MTAPTFDHITDPVFRARLEMSAKRGAFQGWIGGPNGMFAVYQLNGETHGYLKANETLTPDYTGTERGLYTFTGRESFDTYRRF